MAPALLFASLQSLLPLPSIKLSPSGAASPGGWVCVHSRPLWVSPMNSPVRLGVSPTSVPTGVFNQWFEALFPHAGTLGCTVCHPVHQLLPCWPAAAFHTVPFSVTSGCFLFLNCCCPSFGCPRRPSMSTYASILARSP